MEKVAMQAIKAVQRLAGMISSLKQCKTPQEVYDRYLQITGYCKCCIDCGFMDEKGADELMCLAAYLAGNEQARAERLAEEYAKRYACCFCRGRNLHTCNGYSCKEPYQRAYDYAMSKVAAGCMVVKIE